MLTCRQTLKYTDCTCSNEQLQQQLEYTLLKPGCHSRWISKMQSGREEERHAIKFCFKLGKNDATETYGMLQTAFRQSCMNQTWVFVWHKRFKEGKESMRDDERCGRSKFIFIFSFLCISLASQLMPLKNWCSIHARCSKSSLKHSIRFCGIYDCISFFWSVLTSRLHFLNSAAVTIRLCWVYSHCYCSCSFKPEIIKIGLSNHKMYSNNLLNFQECTTILDASTKKV